MGVFNHCRFASLLSLSLLFLFSCKHSAAPNPLADLPDESLLSIPTYDGSGQGVHPDILYLDPPLNGKRFMMAFTPYPYYNDKLENPSVLLSTNGVDFAEPVAGENPIVPAPPYDHNDDPDILYDRHRGLYYLHYLQTMRPDSENVIRLESRDGITWKPFYAVHFDLKKGDPFIVSPSTVLDNNGSSYRMYYVVLGSVFKIQCITSVDGLTWDKRNAIDVNYHLPAPMVPWHLDVFRHGEEFVMLCSCHDPQDDFQHQKLMLATSKDGINWDFKQKPLIESDPNFHQCLSIYRSTGLIFDNTLAVWYSMDDVNGVWKIGVKKFAMDTL
ncbi:MAG: hypothetical protein JWO06_3422 [Bacteroidota bacterium]|nr:hypothetical protein [Bacteroidota bacterium]